MTFRPGAGKVTKCLHIPMVLRGPITAKCANLVELNGFLCFSGIAEDVLFLCELCGIHGNAQFGVKWTPSKSFIFLREY